MKKLILASLVGSTVFFQGCAGVSVGWQPVNPNVGIPNGKGEYIFRNTVYFKNTTPYCTVKVLSGKTKQPVHQKTKFNPVKETFVLHKGGGENFVEYNFNTNNHFRTKVIWYYKGKFLNSEYIGNEGSGDEYSYKVNHYHMGEQRINLSNQHARECWRKERKQVIKIYN